MRSGLGTLTGAGAGAVVGIALFFVLGWIHVPQAVLAAVASPAAHLVAWVTGWPMQQEMGLLCYVVGLAITIAAATTTIGAIVGTLAVPAPRQPP